MRVLINLDVPDLAAAEALYTSAFGLQPGRRFGSDGLELLGGPAPLYLLAKAAGSDAAAGRQRRYDRHWMPCHMDVVVDDLDAALAGALAAGMVREGEVRGEAWGRIVQLGDPFGHGWCLLQFQGRGYDAIASPAQTD